MAKHKSATEVTVVTEERSAIQTWVDKHWGKALVLAIAIAAVIIFQKSTKDRKMAAKSEAWNPLVEATGDLEKTKAAIAETDDPMVKGWGWVQAAFLSNNEEDPQGAIAAIEELTKIDGHILNSDVFKTPGAEGKTMARSALESMQAQLEWENAHPGITSNPDPAAGSTVVTMQTSDGDIEITLYDAKAPGHVENFLKLVDENFYNDILFHRTATSPSMAIIQAGDPNSKESDVSQWGVGGPGYTVPAEKNGLIHTEGVLSAAMSPGSQESSGSQFFITLGRAHHLDGRHTVYGKVTSGLDIARQILEAPTREVDEENQKPDVPVNPVSIKAIARK